MHKLFSVLVSLFLFLFLSCEQADSHVDVRIDVTDIKINNIREFQGGDPNLYLRIGKSCSIDFEVFPKNATESVRWDSTDILTAQVRPTGTIIAMAVGEATISAYNTSGLLLKSFLVRIIDRETDVEQKIVVRYNGVTVKQDTVLQLKNGTTGHVLRGTIEPQGGAATNIFWKSSATTVVDVEYDGRLILKDIGYAVISARADGFTPVQVAIRVTDDTPVENIEIKIQDSLASETKEFFVDDSVQLEAVFVPAHAVSKVNWISSNIQSAVVSKDGLLTAKEAGKIVRITAQSENGGKTSSIDIKTIPARAVKEIQVRPSKIFLFVGETFSVSDIHFDVKPESAHNKAVSWTVDDSSKVGLIDQNITAVHAGVTRLKVTSQDNASVFNYLEVEVLEGERGITIKRDIDFDLLRINSKKQLTVNFTDPRMTNTDVYWHSSNTGLATIDLNGVLTTLQKAGKFEIIAISKADPSLVDKLEAQIVILPGSIVIKEKDVVIDGLHRGVDLTAEVYPVNCSFPIEWSTSGLGVVTRIPTRMANELGQSTSTFVSLAKGTETVTASVTGANGVTVSTICEITVGDDLQISVSPLDTISVGGTHDLIVSTIPRGRESKIKYHVDKKEILSVSRRSSDMYPVRAYSGGEAYVTFSIDKTEYIHKITAVGLSYRSHKGDKELIVTGVGTLNDETSITVRNHVYDVPVTEIAEDAF
ncbi:MAG: Ig-like domain-containing protein, partial [Treponemataceae bacterium]